MRISSLLVPAAIAAAPPAAAQEPVPFLTREQALRLPREQIADIVFRQLARRMEAMSRPDFTGLFPGPAPGPTPAGLNALTFATAPRATSLSGLCEATRIDVAFQDGDGEGGRRATDLAASTVYKVIGELVSEGERTEEEQGRLEARCARAGPVIAGGTSNFGEQTFFSFHGDYHPFAALAALRQAISGARSGAYRDVECASPATAGAPPNCAETLGQLAALDLSRLVDVTVTRLDQGEARYRIEARFLIEGGPYYEISWRVSLYVDRLHSNQMALGRASINRGHAISE